MIRCIVCRQPDISPRRNRTPGCEGLCRRCTSIYVHRKNRALTPAEWIAQRNGICVVAAIARNTRPEHRTWCAACRAVDRMRRRRVEMMSTRGLGKGAVRAEIVDGLLRGARDRRVA